MMKKIQTLLIAVLLASSTMVFAQGNKKVASFRVEGVCGECKERIESALDLKGVKVARWDLESSMVEVVYNPTKIEEMDLHKALVAVGHKTDKLDVTPEVYNSLSNCCKYLENKKHKD